MPWLKAGRCRGQEKSSTAQLKLLDGCKENRGSIDGRTHWPAELVLNDVPVGASSAHDQLTYVRRKKEPNSIYTREFCYYVEMRDELHKTTVKNRHLIDVL